MKELIEAFQIFLTKGDLPYPTHCEHDVMTVQYNPVLFSDEEIERLESLGFHAGKEDDEYDECFYSYRYGSC